MDEGFRRGQRHKGYSGLRTQEKALDRESEAWVLGTEFYHEACCVSWAR